MISVLVMALLAFGTADASVYQNKINANNFQSQAVSFSGRYYIQNVKTGAMVAFNTAGRTPNLALTKKGAAPISLSRVRGKWTRIKVDPSVNKCWSSQWDHKHGINWAATLYACCDHASNCDNGGNQGALRYQKQSFLFVPASASSITRAYHALHLKRDFQSGDVDGLSYDEYASAYEGVADQSVDAVDVESFADEADSTEDFLEDEAPDSAEEYADLDTFAQDDSFESESDAEGAQEANELDRQEADDFMDYMKRSELLDEIEREDIEAELQDNLAFPDDDSVNSNSTIADTDDSGVAPGTATSAPQVPSHDTSADLSVSANGTTTGVIAAFVRPNVEIEAVTSKHRSNGHTSRRHKHKSHKSHKSGKSRNAFYIISVDHILDMKTRVVTGSIMTSAGNYKSLALATLDARDEAQQWRVIRA